MRSARWLPPLVALVVGVPHHVGAQQGPPRITVRVRQVAGASVYLDVGTRHGLAAGDTLDVRREDQDQVVGTLLVTASTETRSLLTFAGDPFPVTRGTSLVLQLLRAPAEAAPAVPVARPSPAGPSPGRPSPPEAGRGPAHGRVTLDMSAMRSTTQVGRTDPVTASRTFATPGVRVDFTVPDAVGPLRLRASTRLTYRYSDRDIVQPAPSARVYAGALEGDLGRLSVSLGRFQSPVERYSGFWDGALLRVGGSETGVGVIAGFEPDRWNERPSISVPKVSAFADGARRGDGWRWFGDVSAHGVRPRDGTPDHTFFGASQGLSVGSVLVSHDLQLDRDPFAGGWRISRLRVQGSMDVSNKLRLRGGVARREPWIASVATSAFGTRSDRADAGLFYRKGGGTVSADVSVVEDAVGRRTWGTSGTFATEVVPRPWGAGASGSVARWTGPYGSTVAVNPSISFDGGPAWIRVGYRANRTAFLGRVGWTHALETYVDAPVGPGLRASGRIRVQLGGLLGSQLFQLSLSRTF